MLVPASGAAAVAQQQQLHAAGSAARPPPPHVGPRPEPAQPHIAAGYPTSNIFWPGDTDANGTVYQCAYIPTLVLANHTRLIAHGNCGTEANSCNGLHIQQSRAAAAAATLEAGARGLPPGTPGNPIQEGKICQKHSDDGGKTWSKLRLAVRGVDTGKIVWDDLRKRLVMHYTTQAKSVACPDCPGGGAVFEYTSTDLGTRSNTSRRSALSFTRGPLLSLTRTLTAADCPLCWLDRRHVVGATLPHRLSERCRSRRTTHPWLRGAHSRPPHRRRRWLDVVRKRANVFLSHTFCVQPAHFNLPRPAPDRNR
jgi:hypothetical protein